MYHAPPCEARVHPHIRGNTWDASVKVAGHRGSSPHVGNTRWWPGRMPWRSVHPRVWGDAGEGAERCRRFIPTCGEHLAEDTGFWIDHGSSPRVGNTPQGPHRVGLTGSSPRVGTHCKGIRRTEKPVHPHVWGTLQDLVDYAVRVRFIPNTAGSSAAHGRGRFIPTCGEHGVYLVVSLGWCGSSRVWGTRYRATVLGDRKRFIPTCVGNTRSGTESPGVRPVHPHVCGEHVAAVTVRVRVIGSSPRVWGTHQAGRGIPPGPRFIPTCVGNTPG